MAKYTSLIEKHLHVMSRSGPELMCLCVFHDDHSASMQVNEDTGLFVCFSCHVGGSPNRLFDEVGIHLTSDSFDPNEDLAYAMKQLRSLDRVSEVRERIYPEESLGRYQLTPEFSDDYWIKQRKLPREVVDTFGLGADSLENAVTIPLRNMDSQVLGVITRSLEEDPEQRYKYPFGFKRSNHLFASWLVEQDPEATRVILCEGAIDAMRCWSAGYYGMAIYGSSLSLAQVRLLKRLEVTRVTLLMDNDSAGRKAVDQCKGFKTHKRKGQTFNEYVPALDLRRFFLLDEVRWPNVGLKNYPLRSIRDQNEGAYDPGDLQVSDLHSLLRNTRRYF